MVASGQTYLIINKKAGTVCDCSGDDQKSVIGYTAKGSDNQKWKVEETGNGNGWTVQNVYNKKYLDLDLTPERPLQNGTKLVAVETSSPRTWDIHPDEQDNDAYRVFVHGEPNLNVDLSDGGNPDPGTPVTVWGKWPGENQVWRFEQA